MTIKETILSFPGIGDLEAFAEKIMTDRQIDGSKAYDSSLREKINLCAADLYVFGVNQADFSEGRLSIKYSRRSFVKMAKKLYFENGEPQNADQFEIGTIQDGTALW